MTSPSSSEEGKMWSPKMPPGLESFQHPLTNPDLLTQVVSFLNPLDLLCLAAVGHPLITSHILSDSDFQQFMKESNCSSVEQMIDLYERTPFPSDLDWTYEQPGPFYLIQRSFKVVPSSSLSYSPSSSSYHFHFTSVENIGPDDYYEIEGDTTSQVFPGCFQFVPPGGGEFRWCLPSGDRDHLQKNQYFGLLVRRRKGGKGSDDEEGREITKLAELRCYWYVRVRGCRKWEWTSNPDHVNPRNAIRMSI